MSVSGMSVSGMSVRGSVLALGALTLAIGSLGLGGMAMAKDFKYFRSAKKDAEVRLMSHTSFRGDCETKAADIKLLDMPKNGEAKIKSGTRRFPKGGKGNMARCDGKTGAAAAVFYTPKKGFEGFDQLRYEVKFASGRTNTVTYRLRIGDAKKPGDDKGWTQAK